MSTRTAKRTATRIESTRLLILPLAAALLSVGCLGQGDDSQAVAAAADNPVGQEGDSGTDQRTTELAEDEAAEPAETEDETVETVEAADEPAVVIDGDACAAMKVLIGEIDRFNGQSFTDPEALGQSFEATSRALRGVRDTAPTGEIEATASDLLAAWTPWQEAFAAVDYDFLAIPPETFDALMAENDLLGDPEAFTENSNRLLAYAVDNCGVSQERVDMATGNDNQGAPMTAEGR